MGAFSGTPVPGVSRGVLNLLPGEGRPRRCLLLNGQWRIQPGEAATPPSSFRHTVPVPALVDAAIPPYRWEEAEYHWYALEFTPAALRPGSYIFLEIDQAQYGTKVYGNGQLAGESIACYTSQQYRIDHLLKAGSPNTLHVRVGQRSNLPPHSAAGRDQEKKIFTPGIWGDVKLICTGNPSIRRVQIIPHIESDTADVKVSVRNLEPVPRAVRIAGVVFEHVRGAAVSEAQSDFHSIPPEGERLIALTVGIPQARRWTTEDPFLYRLETNVVCSGEATDTLESKFGMREFRIVGPDFFLNGRRILLRGGNIAFHRFLADERRGLLPWDERWIRKVLIDLPKRHNFNFFRFHLGQAYNRWYDIADEGGMLLQNEWPFWGVTGSPEQISKEMSDWIADNANHPSIVIWDPLNESTDETLQRDIVPRLKELDPTRPWESVDFLEQHPYIYSLGMVYNQRPLGFASSLDELAVLPRPSVVNEFLWWWLDDALRPTSLMEGIVERWLGPDWTSEQLLNHQSFLARELTELFRRLDVKAILPFVYLSNARGPTGNWFVGSPADLVPKPVLETVGKAFAPFGVSIELWDRHFVAGDIVTFRAFVFNDSWNEKEGVLKIGFAAPEGAPVFQVEQEVRVKGTDRAVLDASVRIPDGPGSYLVRAELHGDGGRRCVDVSEKKAYVFSRLQIPGEVRAQKIVLLDPSGEVASFLSAAEVPFSASGKTMPGRNGLVFLNCGALDVPLYRALLKEVSSFVRAGGVLVVQEPEEGIAGERIIVVLEGLNLVIRQREDRDKGGYDSYVFPADKSHALWRGIEPEHLRMFNGGVGGEMVSEYDVLPSIPGVPLAVCGLGLKIPAVFFVPVGKGMVVVSRIQIRGRLGNAGGSRELFARRPDPVAQRYLVNLLSLSTP